MELSVFTTILSLLDIPHSVGLTPTLTSRKQGFVFIGRITSDTWHTFVLPPKFRAYQHHFSLDALTMVLLRNRPYTG